MRVFVVTETTPEDTTVVGVFAKHADAMREVDMRFVHESKERGWDVDTMDDEHPESFTDTSGGVVGDMAEPEGWVYWHITKKQVA